MDGPENEPDSTVCRITTPDQRLYDASVTERVAQLRDDHIESRLRLSRKGRADRGNVYATMMADPRRVAYVGFQTDRRCLARHGSGANDRCTPAFRA